MKIMTEKLGTADHLLSAFGTQDFDRRGTRPHLAKVAHRSYTDVGHNAPWKRVKDDFTYVKRMS